ncbi:MAG: excinuclease ABC subunit UvrB [Clostridium sp.]|nr:excinuclease ABC subunit UvrB [Prevotella sp.]MCM1428783.1 excinuclease ABC subunit UvrB [Clostridium sp.]MCM1475158.1 excinuclease ABC subunit UvrB [Muribaculaceae bacterium]
MDFKLSSEYCPTGDQPEAIAELSDGVNAGMPYQTLLGVTGSGKTFTIANVIRKVQRPTLILSHNKTLAAQLYSEFKNFFPDNSVQYFVSYYDYYQPEAYIPGSDKYIEKDLMINDQIERLRLSTTAALLSGRRDVIVVSSVSCIYGMGNPEDFQQSIVDVHVGRIITRNAFLRELVNSLYSRTEGELGAGQFKVKGDTVDIKLSFEDIQLRIVFWGDEIEKIQTVDPRTGIVLTNLDAFKVYPANIFVTTKERTASAIDHIAVDLGSQCEFFRSEGRILEAERLRERVTYDLEMIKELGHCSGIENYSRYFDGRQPGARPFCLLDYFPKDFLTIIDESHVTLPQIRGMYGGDLSRKTNLVEYGFRLPAALDNRPLKFDEFERLTPQTIYVSATPGDYELQKSEGVFTEQIIRPTGLLDPEIEVRPSLNQIDDLMEEIRRRTDADERVLVTTLTKRMAEELNDHFTRWGLSCAYIHSDVDALERIRILENLREGMYDVLIGVNLLREGLDLPQVSLVAILDADKEGFLRNHRSLTQTAGRAARNVNGKVIMYADKITQSMQLTIDETNRRRAKQMAYNEAHGITPTPIVKTTKNDLIELYSVDEEATRNESSYRNKPQSSKSGKGSGGKKTQSPRPYIEEEHRVEYAADPAYEMMNPADLERMIIHLRSEMVEAAKRTDFIQAAQYRDEMLALEERLQTQK